MTYRGKVEDGALLLDEPIRLPNGTRVSVELLQATTSPEAAKGKRAGNRAWKGRFRDLGPVPTSQDIADMRRETWPEP